MELKDQNYKRAIDGLGSCCFGCGACEAICPNSCIRMMTDDEGFKYPQINEALCIGCGRCDKVCPSLPGDQPLPDRETPNAWAGHIVSESEWISSSSGGAFSALANMVLDDKGSVYGVVMDGSCRSCSFRVAHDRDEMRGMLGSKYLQADTEGVFASVKKELATGKRVLFCGTPCQVNALASYLQTDWPNLLLVDIICHGVPSPLLWSKCISYLESKRGKRAKHVEFRYKLLSEHSPRNGRMHDRDDLVIATSDSGYMRIYGANICSRPSCYECHAKKRRFADLTIGDYWGIGSVLPEYNDERGCSLILARTPKGEGMAIDLSSQMDLKETTYVEAVASNPCEHASTKRPALRDTFYQDLKEDGYEWVENHYGRQLLDTSLKAAIKRNLIRMGIWKIVRPSAAKMRYGIRIQFANTHDDVPTDMGI